MTTLNNWLRNILTAVLICCAVIITTLVVVQYFSARKSDVGIVKHVSDWKDLSVGRRVSLGNKDAPLKIIEFSDYQCPYCKRIEPNLVALISKYPKRVALVRYDFPLGSIHSHAYEAAIASRCAASQGVSDVFEENLFKADLNSLDWFSFARESRVDDISKFVSCVKNKNTASLVDNDIKVANALGINATPTLVIKGDVIPGMQTEQELDALISNNL